jgi:SpoVK/Ycf46/Vps4 family AAA+-type ATPase
MQPDSDTKRYQELFDDALRRIPAHSPQWTNFNQSDPGVTLVQLFAWVAETLGYRVDRIPESHRAILRKFAARLRRCAHVLILGGSKKARSAPVQFIASKLGLSLCCIDLAAVVSKHLDQTEKNLRQLFDEAKNGGTILFFDEADAMFGKRSKIKDSHDRYANIEVNYLLQRLDQFEGIAILASRGRENFDAHSLRRFKWIVSLGKK